MDSILEDDSQGSGENCWTKPFLRMMKEQKKQGILQQTYLSGLKNLLFIG